MYIRNPFRIETEKKINPMLVLEKYNLRSRSQDQFQSLLSVDFENC